MRDDDALDASLLEATELTLEQAAVVCRVEPVWLTSHIEAGLFPQAEHVGGHWRLTSASITRARRMHQLERDFDAVPAYSTPT